MNECIYFKGYCPKLEDEHTILVAYTEIKAIGMHGTKKMHGECEYSDECEYSQECPVFNHAPQSL